MTVIDQDEQEIILKACLINCAAGQKSDFKKIYKLTYAPFFAIVKNIVKCDSLTEDALQKGYISIWKNAHSFDPEKGKAFVWMLVIVRNRAIDILRSRKRISGTEPIPDMLEDETAKTDIGAQTVMLSKILKTKLRELPDKVRQAILLNVVQGYSSREIGERMSVSPNTAKSWIRRGLQKVRADLGESQFKDYL